MKTKAALSLTGATAILVLATLFAAAPPEAPLSPQDREKIFGDRYAVLIERNIFTRDRPRRYVRPGEPTREKSEKDRERPALPEDSMILTGVVRENGAFAAFIENTRSGTTVKAKVGDAIARGKVTKMSIDSITYELEGKSIVLAIGKTLSGGASSTSRDSGSSAPSGPSGSKASEAPGSGSGAGADILERMRQRRLQEMKK